VTKNITAGSERKMTEGNPGVKCYPNPFNKEVTIEINMQQPSVLSIDVVAVDGRLIRHLVQKVHIPAGIQIFRWDGKNDNRHEISKGIYNLRVTTGDQVQHFKVFRSE
jgi:flagellar hook assembly protein FlgD